MLLCIQYSCQTDTIINQSNIATWTKDLPAQNKDLYQIRLAFGKTLAAALKEEELRNFIKTNSILPGEKVYQELVYALIKDEKLPSGRTVAQVIHAHEDAEVKELFGETLLDRLAQDDPMVAIKLPDIFYETDWDTKAMIPFVGVQTPSQINYSYVFYFHNGYHEFIEEFEKVFYKDIKYFYLMLKYSTDYTMINVNSMANEKNISLFEMFPQFEYCKNNIVSQILKSGIRSDDSPNKIILSKVKCHEIWSDLCSYKGDLGYTAAPCGLPFECPRDCDSDNPLNKNIVLKGFEVRNDLFIFGGLFEESANVSFDFIALNKDAEYKRFVMPSVRYFGLDKFKIDVTVTNREMIYENSKFNVPLVSTEYQTTNEKSKWIPINALMYDDASKDQNNAYVYCINLVFYEDAVKPINYSKEIFYCLQPFYAGNLTIYPSRYESVMSSNHDWCSVGGIFKDNFGVEVTY